MVEPTGPEIHIYADMAGKEICAVTRDRPELGSGINLHLTPMPDRVLLFDQATGKAIGR